ncbi:KaiC domain-containing protein [Natrialbaceae archaeon A-arb3/5]
MTDEDADWFERAISDRNTDEDVGETENTDEDAIETGDATGSDDRSGASDVDGPSEDDDWFDPSRDSAASNDSVLSGASADAEADTTEADEPGSDESETDDEDGGSLFEEDFGSALQNVGDVPVDDESEDEQLGASDVDFNLPGGNDDLDEDPETELPRVDLGIEGLDGMIQGGVPERSLIVAVGSAGTGKTTFGLQFLDHALARGENAVFIALEESRERVINSATEKGFPFDEYVADGRLAIVDIDPVEMAHGLTSIRNELPTLIEEFGASRLVLDSVSLLEMMYDDQAKRRNEVYDFTKSLKEAGVTSLLTSEAAESNPYASRHGIVEYLTDAVFVLQYVRPDDFRETRLAIEIQKIRDANHSREKKPYEITDDGISVHQQGNLF